MRRSDEAAGRIDLARACTNSPHTSYWRHIGVSDLRSVRRRRDRRQGLAGCPFKTDCVIHATTQVDVVPTEGTGEEDSRDRSFGQVALTREYATRRYRWPVVAPAVSGGRSRPTTGAVLKRPSCSNVIAQRHEREPCGESCMNRHTFSAIGASVLKMTISRRAMKMAPDHSAAARFTDRVLVRCPASLPPAIDRAAAKNLMTASEYVRRSVIDRLKADGIDPASLAGAA
jgi:hypothetical protein